jgi:uncharacterized phage protein gp47/JayE
MPSITSTGFQTETYNEIFQRFTQKALELFGSDYVFDKSNFDYVMQGIFTFFVQEMQEVALNVYFSQDYTQAQGINLNRIAKGKGIFRQAGSFTYQNIQITTDRAVNLQGLDNLATDINGTGFQVSDNNGNQFILLDSQNISGAGTYTFSFRAKKLGAISTTINSITNLDTIILGVVSCSNSTSQSSIGTEEENDAELRERIRLSYANPSSSSTDSLYSKLLNISGVEAVKVYENQTSEIDANNIPAKSIWCIIEGGSNENIANVIYQGKTTCGTKGNSNEIIISQSGQSIAINFDRPSSLNLYIKFNLKKAISTQTFNLTAIKQYIQSNLSYSISERASLYFPLEKDNTLSMAEIVKEAVQNNGGGGFILGLLISKDNINWSEYLEVNSLSEKFIVNSSNIAITEI